MDEPKTEIELTARIIIKIDDFRESDSIVIKYGDEKELWLDGAHILAPAKKKLNG